MRRWLFVAASAGLACSSCDSQPPAPAPAPSVSPPPAPPPPAPETKLHPSLAERTPIGEDAGRERKVVLALVAKASAAIQKKDAAAALAAVESARAHDPTSAFLPILAVRAAAGDDATQRRWAVTARIASQGDERLEALLGKAMGANPVPPTLEARRASPEKSLLDACAAVTRLAELGAKSSCVQEQTLALGAEKLRAATVLRLTDEQRGFTRQLAWVALDTPAGFVPFGPVARAESFAAQKAVGDFVVDLQKVDVLPGGSPELVVRLMERETAVDVALNEIAERDQTRVLLLTLDRGELTASKELFLARRWERRALVPKALGAPAGIGRAKDLGKSRSFDMKVEWGGPNEIRLEKTSGDATPPAVGVITLFP